MINKGIGNFEIQTYVSELSVTYGLENGNVLLMFETFGAS